MGSKRRAGGSDRCHKKKKEKEVKEEVVDDDEEDMDIKEEDDEDQPCSSKNIDNKDTQSPSSKMPQRPLDPRKEFSLPLAKINPHIVCSICRGYLIEATTVTECLHTFCKSCILYHFEEGNKNCPKCDIIIHQSHPSHYCAFDRTMQDIVYKLVPGLMLEESERKKEYKAERRRQQGKVEPEKPPEEEEKGTNRCYNTVDPRCSHHRSDEQVIVRLIPERGLETISRPVVRTSHMTTVNTLKRYLAMIMWNDVSKYNQLDIYCNGELMGKDYSMRFIQITQWRHNKPGTPLALTYRPHLEY